MTCLHRYSLGLPVAALLWLSAPAEAVLTDRLYLLGDDPAEVASNNSTVSAGGTFDSAGVQFGIDEFVDLFPGSSAPSYATIAGRPDGGTGLGLDFDAGEFVRGARLGFPATSVTADTTNNYDYDGVSNRGLQLWAKPDAFTPGAKQTLIADTNQHGVVINEAGNYAMLYAGAEFDSGVPATDQAWRHLMVVRPEGAAGGARFYVDGIAVAAAAGDYDDEDTADLVLGANTAGTEEEGGFTGGTQDFYSGLLDDVELFVIGDVEGPNPENGGAVEAFTAAFDFARDNDFAASTLNGVLGDINQDGTFNTADRAAFIDGWLTANEVNGVVVGDLTSLSQGDLNFDGLTDLGDLVVFQSALSGSGMATISGVELVGVPEPLSLGIVASALLPVVGRRQRRS